eukprot:728510-Pelagomonas_calceolata.AAC.1
MYRNIRAVLYCTAEHSGFCPKAACLMHSAVGASRACHLSVCAGFFCSGSDFCPKAVCLTHRAAGAAAADACHLN